ncbi:hypothetical protein D9615_002388 [Tricholomella constricta]|uniref:HNH nuclease domain-containing protein n=1 Tax=Tricholomella constricta TaxID=117010 RepID=A0A8H5HMP6_9AGAR|nr:hypothetical protein D9615_002388 [Tricholomella constricta]
MSLPTLVKVSHPPLLNERDINLFAIPQSGIRDPVFLLYGSSLEGQRSTADFFKILDVMVMSVSGDYKLQKLDNERRPLDATLLDRSSQGNITAGNYLIRKFTLTRPPDADLSEDPSVKGDMIALRVITTFFDSHPEAANPSFSEPAAKKAKRSCGGSVVSDRSNRDTSNDSQGFKMRLVRRDKGCAVCLAAGIQEIFKYRDHSNRYEGSHIVDFAYQKLVSCYVFAVLVPSPYVSMKKWDIKKFSTLVSDPYTDPANAENPLASPTTRTGKDSRRINSLENGILLCLQHHQDYENFRFAIHPQMHEIFSFHPDTAKLQGIEVKAPWNGADILFPPPHSSFLEMHYVTSIANSMKGGGIDYRLEDDEDDEEELSEPEEVHNEDVRIWLEKSISSCGEITAPHDDMDS